MSRNLAARHRFWFFSPANLELMVKVLDGRAVNGHFWVFYGALSDVSYTLTVTDTATGDTRTYTNPPGQLASQADTNAFPDPAAPAGAASRAKASAASILPGSPELQVNVGTAGPQRSPALASDDAGNVMVVWISAHENFLGLYGRIYDPQGNPRTGEFLVARPTTSSLFTTAVAAHRAGEFLVVWDEGGGILARRFGGNGIPLGEPVRLNPASSTASAPSIASRPQGGSVLVWVDQTGIRGLLLDEQANPVGSAFEVAAASIILGSFQRDPSVSVSSAGNFVVAWAAENSLFRDNIHARSFDADGRPQGSAILVNGVAPYQAGFQHGAMPLAFPDGSFLAVWQTVPVSTGGLPGVFSRYFGAGQPPAGILELNPPGTSPSFSSLDLAMDRRGRIVVLWNGNGPGDEDGLFARFLGPTGQPEGDTFLVNVFREQSQTEPEVVASGAGGFAAVWASGADFPLITPAFDPGPFSQDGSYFGIFGRRFDGACPADGVTLCLGDRFRVQVSWTDHDGNTGVGHPVQLALDTGAFWFFGSDNLELMIKVLDGRAVNGHFWVFYGALSDVRYTITVTDTATGATKTYTNPPGQLASRADTEAFPRE